LDGDPVRGGAARTNGAERPQIDLREEERRPRQQQVGHKLAALHTAALDAATDAIVITDARGTILWVSEAFRRLTGYRTDEAVGRNARFLESGPQPPEFYQALWDTILSGRPWRGELVSRRKDGTLYNEEMAVTPVPGRGHRPSYLVAIKRDITEQKRRDRSNLWLARAVDHSSDMIGVTDLQGRYVVVNPAFFRVLGYTTEELLGTSFKQLLSPNNSAKVLEEIAARRFQDGGWAGECLALRRDGTDCQIELSVGPVKGSEGDVIGAFGIARDLSQEKVTKMELQRSEEQFRQLAEHIRDVFFVCALDPVRITYFSPAYEKVWGRPRQEAYDRLEAWIESVHPEDRDYVGRVFARAIRGEATVMEYRIVRPGGEVRWIKARSFPVQDTAGALYRVVGLGEDITDQKHGQQALEEGLARTQEAHERLAAALRRAESQARDTAMLTEIIDVVQACPTVDEAYTVTGSMLAKFFAAQPGALGVTKSSRNIVEVVAAWGDRAITATTFGPDDCWALRRGKLHVIHDASDATRCGHFSDGLAGGAICVPLAAHGETLGVLCVGRSPDAAGAATAGPQDGHDADVRRVALVAERLSLTLANVQLREALKRQSIRDPLTGLFNRRFMEESLERELQRAVRSREPVTLLMLDLDHFKKFNDTYGHPAGDALLRTFGQFLAQRVRGHDLACRYGGEEFLIILAGTSAEDARARADALRAESRELGVRRAEQVLGGVTFSVGVATYPTHGDNRERLIAAADQALYRAKAEGRDRVVIAEPVLRSAVNPPTPIA